MELTISDEKTKELLTEVLVEMIKEKREVFQEIVLEAIEEIGLANAISEGRKKRIRRRSGNNEHFRGRKVKVKFEAVFAKDLKKYSGKKALLKRITKNH